MSLPVKSQSDLYNLFINTLQDERPDLTDTLDGSIIDALGGVFSVAATELTRLIINQFNKTFIELANGPEVTGGPDDLQALAVDHYGNGFERPGAVAAIDTVTFHRANNSHGVVTILAGSIVKTAPDANGVSQRYKTANDVTMTNTSLATDTNVTVNVRAVVAGAAGNAAATTINVIETSLTDSTITVSNVGNATGQDSQDDSIYRETIRNLIEALAGATANAVAAKAKTVTGIVTATPVEQMIPVIQYNIATGGTIGGYFRLAVPTLFVADKTGTASGALLQAVRTAIDTVRSLGVSVSVQAASAVTVNWTATIVLNPSGPNYSVFQSNPQEIRDSMLDYINNLPIGTSFVRATANAAILALWGASGTNDITSFSTSVPSGDVAATASQKMVAGSMVLV